MPSYRVTLALGRMKTAIDPTDVLPFVRDACAEVANVESCDIRLERGVPVIVTRFTALNDAEAATFASHTRVRVDAIADVHRASVTKRVKNTWPPLGVPLSESAPPF